MTQIVTIFVDALKPDSLRYMDFLGQLESRRIATELGYSNTCHASMYSGVPPKDHRYWFIWEYNVHNSPFSNLRNFPKVEFLNSNPYFKYALYNTLQYFKHKEVLAGFPLLAAQPLSKWYNFSGKVVSPYCGPNDTINGYPTVFTLLKKANVQTSYNFCNIGSLVKTFHTSQSHNSGKNDCFRYYFIGEIDSLSHKYGYNAKPTVDMLMQLDKAIENIYSELEKQGDDVLFFVYSDHGHEIVTNEVDLIKVFKSCGRNIKEYLHFIDTNFARFWCETPAQAEEIIRTLTLIEDKGFILNNDHYTKYNVSMPDNRYGDIIFYLEKPNIFTHESIKVLGKERTTKIVSMHGYLPDHPEMDGVLVANKKIIGNEKVKLIDIAPSVLSNFNVCVPSQMKGKQLW